MARRPRRQARAVDTGQLGVGGADERVGGLNLGAGDLELDRIVGAEGTLMRTRTGAALFAPATIPNVAGIFAPLGPTG